jgi:NADH:ubiquinone oxidoreductase subunit F (NADH-binding)/(2Fe-2S) ferredoxin/Pyruvate/2-oxoacid:ferredoxin oxidoreductase delta subunit
MKTEVTETFQKIVQEAETFLNTRDEEGKIRIQVGSATCEHAAGSVDVMEEFRRLIAASEHKDIILRRTGCTGRCSREPIVGVVVPGQIPIKYERVDRDSAHAIFTNHVLGGKPVWDRVLDAAGEKGYSYEVMFCDGLRCDRVKRFDVRAYLEKKLSEGGPDLEKVRLFPANCFGLCAIEQRGKAANVLVRPDNVLYSIETKEDMDEVIKSHFLEGKVVTRLVAKEEPISQRFFDLYGDVSFFNRQSRIALRNCGVIDPENIFEYVHYRGFEALAETLSGDDTDKVIREITSSHLRGRGGGGYSTGLKWAMVHDAPEKTRYIICNADEGDPGAFMDRSMLESDPFSVIEGMITGGYAIGAHRSFVYVRAEYPMAIKRIQFAIDECYKHGFLGKNILGSGYDLDMEIRLGAGAFVCGEETALIHSIEGERGQPRVRPPYPAAHGLWGKPTVINNVETFANVPAIILYGGEWFKSIGTEKSGGTKVFALAGKVQQTGLVEVPMGTTLREVVFSIGGGVPKDKKIKGVLTGGPAGGCIPEKWLDTAVDFESLTQAGSIMGSGGMIILDEDDCMVDVAKFFMTFSQDESCGKCTPCREGTKRMLEILERITKGRGVPEDVAKLERLGNLMRKTSLCGLGRAAANPILSSITHFRHEYESHIRDKTCPAKKCTALIHYEIDPEKCVGCTLCAKNCPVQCISGIRRETHLIDQSRCIKCGKCFEVCRFSAVKKL